MTKAIDKKVDGKEIGRKLDKELDERLGGASEKIQRQVITNLLCEIIEGLWEESPDALKAHIIARYGGDR